VNFESFLDFWGLKQTTLLPNIGAGYPKSCSYVAVLHVTSSGSVSEWKVETQTMEFLAPESRLRIKVVPRDFIS
jgi:hypothetical protein